MKERVGKEEMAEEVVVGRNMPVVEVTNLEKLQGDARDYLNAKRVGQKVVESIAKDTINGQQQVLMRQPNEVQNDMANAEHDCEGVISTVTGVMDNSTTPHASAPIVPLEEVLNLDKGPTKPSKDVPATTIFERMHLATAGAMQADADRAKIVWYLVVKILWGKIR